MHEAGIMASILDVVEREAHGRPVAVIHLRVGEFTALVREALEFAFDALKPGTIAARAQLEIETPKLVGRCPRCGWQGTPVREFCLVCARCSEPVEVISGRELEISYLDLFDNQLEEPLLCAPPKPLPLKAAS